MKEILKKSGFDTPEYLCGLTEFQLNQLEENINLNRTMFENIQIECLHIANYKNNQNFKFLFGHRFLILNFAKIPAPTDTNRTFARTFEHPSFPILLKQMIKTALNNYEKSSTSNRYPELLMDFAIYIYIMGGKACYEVVAANLPLPSTNTIRNNNF